MLLKPKSFGKYVLHCSGIDPFVTLMGNFNWGPISRNDTVSINRGVVPRHVFLSDPDLFLILAHY